MPGSMIGIQHRMAGALTKCQDYLSDHIDSPGHLTHSRCSLIFFFCSFSLMHFGGGGWRGGKVN